MKASILAIGTELTSGQIVNRNASTISERLTQLGLDVVLHQTVPDQKRLIMESLHLCFNESDIVFVTGGLGPTSDDFTRQMIAEFTSYKLIYDENSWNHIVDRLTSRGFTVRDMQKQQCYFPENSEILTNQQGTAHGFKLNFKNKHFIVLPGPPREIDSIWKDHLQNWLENLTKNINKKIVKSWDIIGVGESDVAHSVEEVLKTFQSQVRTDLYEIGYRVHLPYVETKVIYQKKDENLIAPLIESIDIKLSGFKLLRDQKDIVQSLIPYFKKQFPERTEFIFYDTVSEGFLNNRIQTLLKELKDWSYKQTTHSLAADFFENEDNFLALLSFDSDPDLQEAFLICSIHGKRLAKTIKAPMQSSLMKDRRRQYFAEMSLIELHDFMTAK